MNDTQKTIKLNSRGVTRKSDGNPEGKGLNEFLSDRNRSEPHGVVAKPKRRLLREFFTSMLVLSAGFKFRPVTGKTYYLYCLDHEWSLSLVGPDEWSYEKRSNYGATCVLQTDMTWKIDPSSRLSENSHASEAIRQYYDAFLGMLDTNSALEKILPFHLGKLPYYQRLYASALSRSLYISLLLGDQTAISGRQWYKLASLPEYRIAHQR